MSIKLRIELVDVDGNEVTSFDVPSNPFREGDIISVDRNNYNKEKWNVEELHGVYKVISIEHYVRQTYSYNMRYDDSVCVSIEVEKID